MDTSDSVCPTRVRAMLASRACRSSVMIGDPLGRNEMQKVITILACIDLDFSHGEAWYFINAYMLLPSIYRVLNTCVGCVCTRCFSQFLELGMGLDYLSATSLLLKPITNFLMSRFSNDVCLLKIPWFSYKVTSFTWFLQIIERLADLKSPWNCPHGRPTMRHLVDLTALSKGADVNETRSWLTFHVVLLHGFLLTYSVYSFNLFLFLVLVFCVNFRCPLVSGEKRWNVHTA